MITKIDKVPWNNHATEAFDLVLLWLSKGVGEEITASFLRDKVREGMAVIIPHNVWVHEGFSGSSRPPYLFLDYKNCVAAIVKHEDKDKFLVQVYRQYDVSAPAEYTHMQSDAFSLCGSKTSALTGKAREVDCPHCLLEINMFCAPASTTIN